MPVYFHGRLINVGKNEFTGEKGEHVVYFINTIAHEQGIITINSRRDFTPLQNIVATITLSIRPDKDNPKLYKVSLSDISPSQVGGVPEGTIR